MSTQRNDAGQDEPLRVLIVDDDQTDCQAARRALQRAGMTVQVDEVATCAAALDALSRAPYDCLFLDFQLPDGDGLHLLRQMQEAGLDVPAVMLTGHDDPEMAAELVKAGAVDYLAKSRLTPDTLARRLQNAVRVRRAERQAQQAEDARLFLVEAGAVLSSSLDYETTLANVARLAVPRLADWCAVDVLDAQGTVQRVKVAHVSRVRERLARELDRRYPTDMSKPNGVPEVLRSGHSEMVSHVSDALLAANAHDETHLQALREVGFQSYLCVPLRARGRTLGTLTFVSTTPGHVYGPPDLLLTEQLAERAAIAVDNARLFLETQARAERESVVNAIGKALRGSLDKDEILRVATEEVGRALQVSRCSWAWINAAHDAFEAAPQQYLAPGAAPITERVPFSICPPALLEDWAAGQATVVTDARTDPRFAGEAPRARTSSPPPTRGFISCPVFTRDQWIGVFSAHQLDRPRAWTAEEVALLTQVADLLAPALENARLYAREHRVADILQAAFLSNIPDRLETLTLATVYRAGLTESQVGGDFYDAFLLPDGRVGLVIADVSGKGLGAAVLTATVKYSLRAFAAEVAAPGLVLTRLNRTLRGEASGLGEHFVTLFYGAFHPASGRLVYASAGHETQIIKRAGGGTALLPASGPILGIAEHRYDQRAEWLGRGDSLVLYTDGLTEARDPQTRALLDLSGVAALLEQSPPQAGPGLLAARLEQSAIRWAGGKPHDDLALLVAQRQDAVQDGAGETAFPVERALAAPDTLILEDEIGPTGRERELLFQFAFPSRADFAAEVRQAVAHWMATLGFGRTNVEDFQTAVTEAVTNAVRHGSPDGESNEFRVAAYRVRQMALAVEVTDSGRGLSNPDAHPIMPEPEALGGRGLPLMRELADAVEYALLEGGLRVRLLKHCPVPGEAEGDDAPAVSGDVLIDSHHVK